MPLMQGRPIIFFFAAFSYFSAIVLCAEPNETIVSHIKRQHVDSTAIATVGYSKRLRALEIEFVNGSIYRYLDVSTSLYQRLMEAASKASFYDKNIRGKYRSVHVKPHPK
jgi:hypothetical protein